MDEWYIIEYFLNGDWTHSCSLNSTEEHARSQLEYSRKNNPNRKFRLL
jgi:hypothetical protein